jgi:hypothetical protein
LEVENWRKQSMPAARSRGRLADPLPEPKPRADAYVGLLAVSLIAMVTGTIFLMLDYMQYDKAPPSPPKYQAPAPPPPAPGGGGTGGTTGGGT